MWNFFFKPSPPKPTQRHIELLGQSVSYTLKRSARRSIGFRIAAQGLQVHAPQRLSLHDLEVSIKSKASWIVSKLSQQAQRHAQTQTLWLASPHEQPPHAPRLLYHGQALPLHLGAPRLHWQADAFMLHLPLPEHSPLERIRPVIEPWLKHQAREHFVQRCQHYSALMNAYPSRVSLSSAKTRWGSASSTGCIRLNWRLIHLSPSLIDYVVVHELAHLHEMNHSPRFWHIVRSHLPEFEQTRNELKQVDLSVMG